MIILNKIFIILFIMATFLKAEVIYDFSSKNKLKGWNVVDDNVMGGRSRGSLRLDSEGNECLVDIFP